MAFGNIGVVARGHGLDMSAFMRRKEPLTSSEEEMADKDELILWNLPMLRWFISAALLTLAIVITAT